MSDTSNTDSPFSFPPPVEPPVAVEPSFSFTPPVEPPVAAEPPVAVEAPVELPVAEPPVEQPVEPTPAPAEPTPVNDTPVDSPAVVEPPVVAEPLVSEQSPAEVTLADGTPAPVGSDGIPILVADKGSEKVEKTFVLGGGNPRHGEMVFDVASYDHEPNKAAFASELLQRGFKPVGDVAFVGDAINADGYSLDLTYSADVAANVAPEAVTVPAVPFLVDNSGAQITASEL